MAHFNLRAARGAAGIVARGVARFRQRRCWATPAAAPRWRQRLTDLALLLLARTQRRARLPPIARTLLTFGKEEGALLPPPQPPPTTLPPPPSPFHRDGRDEDGWSFVE